MNAAAVVQALKKTRPRARQVSVVPDEAYRPDEIPGVERLYAVTLHDEQVEGNVVKMGPDLLLLQNTYLTSFAYQLGVGWLYALQVEEEEAQGTKPVEPQLQHLYKKLFAEQLYRAHSNVFSRSILLETLLYEQPIMMPLLQIAEQNEALNTQARFLAELFVSLLSNRELAPLYLDAEDRFWQGYLSHQGQAAINFWDSIRERYPEDFLETVKCDFIAVQHSIAHYRDAADFGFLLNGIAWSFATYTLVSTLSQSAAQTMQLQQATSDVVDLHALQSPSRDYDYLIGEDSDLNERARLMISYCTDLAWFEGIDVFEEQIAFPLPESVLSDSLGYLDRVMENEDPHARSMSIRIAESLHGHEAGMEYLYHRSTSFLGYQAEG